jgi:SOS regulatory protein LexA
MVETKQPGEDMDRAMKELKSYASCCPSAEYLVITDGYNTRIERNHQGKFEIVTVLPEYVDKERNMYEEYTFVRVKGKKEYFYRINREDAEEIIVEEKNTKEAMDCKHFHKMNIIGTVAAGVLKYANKEVSGTYFLPDDFGVNGRDDFMLKVSGDSMIDFQVDDGDYVVVKRQSYAQPGDIVIAGKIGQNEVTLKKYYNMQGNIMLTPGNPKYEPIMIPENEIFINGIVCGILKPR